LKIKTPKVIKTNFMTAPQYTSNLVEDPFAEYSFQTIDSGVNFAGKTYNSAKVKKILEMSKCVTNVISISNSLKEIPINKQLSLENESLYYTAGVHPHDAKSVNTLADLEIIRWYLTDPKCVAVGECGLDYNRMFSPKEKQIKIFKQQIEIARETNKPLYLHCRDAFDDFYSILKSSNYHNGLIHCFTGNKHQAELFIELGFSVGITGWLLDTRRNSDLYEAIKSIPIHSIVVETDAPWLSIKKGRTSHPLDTGAIVNEIAKIKQIDAIKLGHQIHANTKKLFNI
jgi:TatD DNase family protein